MIVREHSDKFIMIEQHNHARVSGDIMARWKDALFLGEDLRDSVEYAIYQHDLGWRLFDHQPFWDDKESKPYTFSSFPISPKIVLYQYGIDEAEKQDPYAALLCSEHYIRFLTNHTSVEAQAFVNAEKERQTRIRKSFPELDEKEFQFHYGLVQLGDNLSLYLCLNEPGVDKEKEHPFFRGGIPLNTALFGFKESKLMLDWTNKERVRIHEFPFDDSFQIEWKEKHVKKQIIEEKGLIKAYVETPFTTIKVEITP